MVQKGSKYHLETVQTTFSEINNYYGEIFVKVAEVDGTFAYLRRNNLFREGLHLITGKVTLWDWLW